MQAEEFDERFDRGEDITSALDLERARRPGAELWRVNVERLGVTRRALIKVWIAERLEQPGSWGG